MRLLPGARERFLAKYGPWFQMYRQSAYWYSVIVVGKKVVTGTLATLAEPRSSSASVLPPSYRGSLRECAARRPVLMQGSLWVCATQCPVLTYSGISAYLLCGVWY